MPEIKVKCPAKINLTLKITGKRPDGFHNIESIMQTINLFDILTIKLEKSDSFCINLEGNSNEIPYDEKNIVYKAIKLYFENLPEKYHINVYIDKNIPVAAGLAGGSTDAAGVLFGINKLLNEQFSKSKLHEICAKLGSDLNFCLEGGRQMTSGRGEILNPLQFEEFNLSLIKPQAIGISAKEAYLKFSDKLQNGCAGREDFINDLEWGLIENYPELKKIKNIYPKSIMSGSGSTYYIINDTFSPIEGYWIKNNLRAIPYGVTEI